MGLTIFAKRLRAKRESLSMSQKDLAIVANITPATISAYEKSDGEKGKKPTLESAQKIAEALNVSLDWLCGISEKSKDDLSTIDILRSFINATVKLGLQVNVNENVGYDQISKFEYVNDDAPCIIIKSWSENLNCFLSDFKKIESVLSDNSIPDYLKVGLQNTIFDKYKNYVITDNCLMPPQDSNQNENVIDEDDDDYPF